MIKLVIFDLDGVLVDSRELHYQTLNAALSTISDTFCISREEHLSTYDGLSTKRKLEILTKNKGLDVSTHSTVWNLKQAYVADEINKFQPDYRIRDVLYSLKQRGLKLACCTNSIRDTAKLQLIRKGFFEYIDFFVSNEDVLKSKPDSEMYLKAMLAAGVNPDETLIIEDSPIGRRAAFRSGARLHSVKNSNDVILSNILESIAKFNTYNTSLKWVDSDLNVLIPLAGAGSRFEKAGYTLPKPLIDINGKPMIQTVVDNLNIDARYIFIVQQSHYEKYNLKSVLNLISPHCEIIQVSGVTEGAACTTLLAKAYINNNKPLLIANSDQYVDWDSSDFIHCMSSEEIDAGILTFESNHPKWSYVKLNQAGFVEEVAEKKPISINATVGIYYWKRGSDYVEFAERMIQKNIRVNNEFYVCPVFNQAIETGKKIKTFSIDSTKMWGLGTPEDLEFFIANHKR